jgi:hypothetical protein
LAVATAETLAWIAAVEAADGQQLEDSALEPMVTLANWRIPLGGVCLPMCGARTLAGALVPMVGPAPTGVNLVPGDYSRVNGIAGDGTTKSVNTGYNHNASGQNSFHGFVNASANPGGAGYYFGAGATEAGATQVGRFTSSANWVTRCQVSTSIGVISFSVTELGLIGVIRETSLGYRLRVGAGSENLVVPSQAPLNNNLIVFARGTAAVAANHIAATLNFYSFGAGISTTIESEFVTRVGTFTAAIAAALS